MPEQSQTKLKRKGDIGFTFEEDGQRTLPNGQRVPAFKGKPNDPEAHERLMRFLQKDLGKTA